MIYAVVSSLINRVIVGAKISSEIACALLPLSMVGITVAFVLYEAIFVIWEINNVKGDGSMRRLVRIVATVCISASLLFAIFSANTYTKLGENSISKVCFVTTNEYRWAESNDILSYSLSCDADGNLSYTVNTKDGKSIEFFGSVNSCSGQFIEKHSNLYGYAAYLSNQFDNSQFIIEKKISGQEYMEKHYKDTGSEIWKYLEQIIN